MTESRDAAAVLRGAPLAAEHRRLMDERHRVVDFTRTTAHALSPALRAHLAEHWRSRLVSEHRAVGIFHLFALDLLAVGAPIEFSSGVARAALDELRHAELAARVAALYSDQPEAPPPGVPPLTEDPSISLAEQVAREALHLCVGSETFSSVLLQAKRERARDPVVRDVLSIFLADEVHHARLGWAYLAHWLAADPDGARRAFLAAEIAPLFTDLTTAMFGDPRALPASPLTTADATTAADHGWMSAHDEYALFCAAIADVWTPGLRELGLPAPAAAPAAG